jgi:hypothetical protein
MNGNCSAERRERSRDEHGDNNADMCRSHRATTIDESVDGRRDDLESSRHSDRSQRMHAAQRPSGRRSIT